MRKGAGWVLVLLCVTALGVGYGIGRAQEGSRRYAFLPAKYSQPYEPTVAEWFALRATANFDGPFTNVAIEDKLVLMRLRVDVGAEYVEAMAWVGEQPGWKRYLGAGRFDLTDNEVKPALQEAVRIVRDWVMGAFPELDDRHLVITFRFLRDDRYFAKWHNGVLRLLGEPGFTQAD